MGIGLLGKKLGMTQVFDENGNIIPVTVIQAGPCLVIQKKTEKTDGYNAIQFGFDEIKKVKNVNKPMIGHFKKANIAPLKFIKEFRVTEKELESTEIGSQISVDIFQP